MLKGSPGSSGVVMGNGVVSLLIVPFSVVSGGKKKTEKMLNKPENRNNIKPHPVKM